MVFLPRQRRPPTFVASAAMFLILVPLVSWAVTAQQDASEHEHGWVEEKMLNSPYLKAISIQERCRLFPTWSTSFDDDDDDFVSAEECGRATSYFPRHFGLFNGSSWEFPHQDLQWMYQLQDCMQHAQEQRWQAYANELHVEGSDENEDFDFWKAFLERYPLKSSTVDFEYPSLEILQIQQEEEGANHVPPVAIIVENALHIREADTLQDLRQCLQENHGHLTENRPFGQGYDNGGNNCVFLAGFLQWLAPGVAAQIRLAGHVAWAHGHWGDFVPPRRKMHPHGYTDPWEAGIRTSGHLSYEGWEALGPHKDNDSLYTVLVMLSDPEDYDGGELYMEVDRSGKQSEQQRNFDRSHPPMVIKPKKYSAVVFMSDENTHQVLSIHGGDRQTVGTELWEYGDAPFGIMRPSPEMWSNFQRNHDWWNFD
jgi:2OG-Fe(II) oxygenase superfamily